MARIFSTKEPFPAAAVTFATPESNHQHILFTTRYDVQGAYTIASDNPETTDINEAEVTECSTQLQWAIKSVSISNLRDWSQSTALITLTVNIPEINFHIPPLPRVDKWRGTFQTENGGDLEQYPFLAPEDEIRIYAGYVQSPTTPITGDMLDDMPFKLEIPKEFQTPGTDVEPDPTKPLVPVFWGFIDKIDFDASPKSSGYNILISCRDRARIFADMKLLSLPSLDGLKKGATTTTTPVGRLDEIIRDVCDATVGKQNTTQVTNDRQKQCWKDILVGENFAPVVEVYNAYSDNTGVRRNKRENEDTLDPSLWMRRAAFKTMDSKARPRFHTWLNRPPLAKEGGTATWQIIDRSPMEIIKWIAEKEERPTDFFCSHVNGDFVLGPRALDVTGFNDPDRMYRTYFFQRYPTEGPDGKALAPPCVNQLILKFRSFSSTVGTFNRFVVIDTSATNGAGSSLFEDIQLTLDRKGQLTKNRKTPCRQRILYDGALSTYNKNVSGAALMSALSASGQFSRDIGGVQFTVLGDPTFFPGEAVRVYNTILHDNHLRSPTGRREDIQVKERSIEELTQAIADGRTAAGGVAPLANNAAVSNSVDNEVVRLIEEAATQLTNLNAFRLPTYKVRAITHVITTTGKNAGYTTTIQAALDLN